MSNLKIKQALEAKLNAMQPGLETAWENVNFPASPKYQVVYILFAEPENPTFGNDFYRQRGYMQVSLRYPQNQGAGAILARADKVRDWFNRGTSLTVDDVTVIIERTPEISVGSNEGDKYVVNVFVRFFANIYEEQDIIVIVPPPPPPPPSSYIPTLTFSDSRNSQYFDDF